MLNKSDKEIEDIVMPEVERYFPEISRSKRFTHIIRWKEAIPLSPIGRSRMIDQYRKSHVERRIILAGDYMGFPYTDGAAETGQWAANRILKSL